MSLFINETHNLMNIMALKKVHILYTGPFDSDILSVIARSIESSLTGDPIINKKLFKIFIELCQNISYYSDEQEEVLNDYGELKSTGIGTIAIQEFDDYFTFATGNITALEKITPVLDKCKKINSLDREGLREFRREMRKLEPSSRGGGNIGLIQVALTAENSLEYALIPVQGNEYFYTIGVKINKKY